MPKKTDANQAGIVDALRKIGASVETTHMVGKGFPDIVVGFKGYNLLMEIKSGDAKLNEREVIWHKDWKGDVVVVRSPEEAIAYLLHGSIYLGN